MRLKVAINRRRPTVAVKLKRAVIHKNLEVQDAVPSTPGAIKKTKRPATTNGTALIA
jgi:hypothetical protein